MVSHDHPFFPLPDRPPGIAQHLPIQLGIFSGKIASAEVSHARDLNPTPDTRLTEQPKRATHAMTSFVRRWGRQTGSRSPNRR
jgi:hypothetical protein